MALKKIMGIFACTLILGSAAMATAGVPDLGLSEATRAYLGAETAVLFNVPNGGGAAFTDAVIPGQVVVDATITLTLVDGSGTAIPNFPFEDAWIESADGGMVACIGGATADANTDALGQTQWQTPLQAGGASEALTVVYISGAPLTSSAGVAISHNSTDLNADGVVNLTDVPIFAGDFYGGVYQFRSDFAYDGAVNLSDVVRLAQSLGAACP